MNFQNYLKNILLFLNGIKTKVKPLLGNLKPTLKINQKEKALKLTLALFSIGLVAITLFILFLRLSIRNDIPSTKELSVVKNPLASELYSENEQLIGQYYIENRTELDSTELNPFYRKALLATEDVRFYEHNGVDFRSLFRVFFKTLLLQKQSSGGGSTITQQLAKNLFPRKSYSTFSIAKNKLREMIIAKRLENIYTKEDILLLYSNTVSFGEKAFGLGTASKRFFNKAPKNLMLEEAAVLVGLLKATSYYSPRNNPENAIKRRNVVLNQMEKYDFITKTTQKQLSKLPLKLNYQPAINKQEFAPYFKEYIKKQFYNWSANKSKPDGSKYDLFRDGLKIYTTINYDFQIAAEEAMASHMRQLQKRFLNSWKGGKLFGNSTKIIDDNILRHPEYIKSINAGKTKKEALALFTTTANRELWDWNGYHKKNTTKIDSIKHDLSLLHTGILAIQPQTGAIKAWVGGINFNHFQYDNVLGKRQVGSTFKPIVYLAGLESGITPCDSYDNTLKTYPEYQNWTPRNANGKYGGKLTLQQALTNSVNTVSAQVLFNTGIPRVIKMSRKLGIESRLDEVPSIVLGTSDVSLLEMVKAYSVFANEGRKTPIVAINRIEDSKGNILFKSPQHTPQSQHETVVDSTTVNQLNGMLQLVTKQGTARALYNNYDINVPVMGKTGTTQNQSDGWFIGYNKNLVIGAWVGASDRRIHFRNLGTGSGGRTALPLVASLFEYANSNGEMDNTTFPNYELDDCDTNSFNENNLDQHNKNPFYRNRQYRDYRRKQRQHEKYNRKQNRLKKYQKAKEKWKKRLNSIFKKRKN